MGLMLGVFGGIAVLAVLVIARELGLVPARFAARYGMAALVVLLGLVPVAGAVLGFFEGRAKLD